MGRGGSVGGAFWGRRAVEANTTLSGYRLIILCASLVIAICQPPLLVFGWRARQCKLAIGVQGGHAPGERMP
jgi:hypothetical protein